MARTPGVSRSIPSFFLCLCVAALSAAAHAADISALLNKAGTAAKSGNAAAGVEALEQALEALRLEAPLTVKPFMAVSRPAKFFGDYEARKDAVFGKGEALNFYLEPKNLVYSRSASGVYEPAFEVDLEVVAANGTSIGKKPALGTFRFATRSPLQDIFMNLKVTLTGVPAGQYGIRFLVRDLNSKKTALAEQRITVR